MTKTPNDYPRLTEDDIAFRDVYNRFREMISGNHNGFLIGINHCRTVESRGYLPHQQYPRIFHEEYLLEGVSAFDKANVYEPPAGSRMVLTSLKTRERLSSKTDYDFSKKIRRLTSQHEENPDASKVFVFDSFVDLSDIRPVGERICVDESHQFKVASVLTDEEKEFLNTDPFGIKEDLSDDEHTVTVRMQKPSSLPNNDEGDDLELIDIGGGTKIARGDYKRIIANSKKIGRPFGSVSTGGLSISAHTQGVSRTMRSNPDVDFRDLPDFDQPKDACPATTALREDELDALEYPMPGHVWDSMMTPQNSLIVLKSTPRCLWIKQIRRGSLEVHVMNRDQFRSFLTHHGDHDDWKTSRPNWRKPQGYDDTLRFMLTAREYPNVDDLDSHLRALIDNNNPYHEHTPV